MLRLQTILKVLIGSILVLYEQNSFGQFVSKVIDYLPAPGQYTNADFIGTPVAANSIVGSDQGIVSLGAFGGSITVYFENGIQNDPANPYGVDFTIYGNATSNWSEPGIIQVMKDENKNGIPDDTWYEIAGSDHFWNSTNYSYEVTYFNNNLNSASNIPWTDNLESSGFIPENSFHQQSYYPNSQLFPDVSADKYTLKGTRISGQIDLSNLGVVNSYRRAFGYADNTPVISTTEKLPDNPYTPEIEGSGGDAIDIDWAVDKNMNPVHLDEINFIRIYTGMNALAGWLGEISTEIAGIRDVEPATVSGTQSMIVIQDLPQKIRLGENLDLNAILFQNGHRQQNVLINWTVSNPDLATIQSDHLIAQKNGIFRLRATSGANSEIFAEKEIEIFSVAKAIITPPTSDLKVNDKIELEGKLIDQNGNPLSGISMTWRSGDEHIASITTLDGKYFLNGKQVGTCWLYLEVPDMLSIRDSILIEVFSESIRKKVYVTVKNSEKTIIPRQSMLVDRVDLTSKVDRNQKTYGLQDIGFISLAHAIAATFKKANLENEWFFRDDAEGGSSLYLWKVPAIEDGSIAYYFGYGGSRSSAAYRKAWIVLLNQMQILSGFDQIKVNNDDEVLVYQITDNSVPWTVTQLTSGNDSIKTNQSIEIQLTQYSCTMDDQRNISVNGSTVLANQTVMLESVNEANNLISVQTDEFGKADFLCDKPGEYLINSGIDAVKLIVDSNTGNRKLKNNLLSCTIYPNPFTENICLESENQIDKVELFNQVGQLILRQTFPPKELYLKDLTSGIYIVKINIGNKAFQQKIIKK